MTELPDLLSLLKKAMPLANRRRRYSSKIILRRLELVKVFNDSNNQLLNYSQLGKILKTSDSIIARDCAFLKKYRLLSPLRQKTIPFQTTETFNQYIERFLAAHGVEL